jgi:hypothetical protein
MANQPDDLFGTAICALGGPVTGAVLNALRMRLRG